MTAVVLDTDIGTDIDDTWALAFLLRCPELDLRLVTTATGDTTYRAALTAGLLSVAGRDDVPIGVGVPTGLPPQLPPRPQARFANRFALASYRGDAYEDGVSALAAFIMQSDEPVTVIATGPMTNIAAALALQPAVAGRARVVAMLGSLRRGYLTGPVAGPVAEYNVAMDVTACRAVLAASWEITIAPLDVCGEIVLRSERYSLIRRTDDALIAALLENYREWYEVCRTPGSAFSGGFDQLDRHFDDTTANKPFWERSSTVLYDTVAVRLAFDEELMHIEPLPIAVEDDGLTRVASGAPGVRVATAWRDRGRFEDELVRRLSEPAAVSAT